jgi:ArsR family transcriptional regulator
VNQTIVACCEPVCESALDPDQAELLAGWFRLLADPARLRLLSMIASRGEVCACELVEPLGVSQPTVSYHLKVLHRAGLLDRKKRGRQVYYQSVPERLAILSSALVVKRGGQTPATVPASPVWTIRYQRSNP